LGGGADTTLVGGRGGKGGDLTVNVDSGGVGGRLLGFPGASEARLSTEDGCFARNGLFRGVAVLAPALNGYCGGGFAGLILLVAKGGSGAFFFFAAAAVADDISVVGVGTCVRSDVVSISFGVRKKGLEEDERVCVGDRGTVRTSGCVCAGYFAQPWRTNGRGERQLT
jgi:hypothetical protein